MKNYGLLINLAESSSRREEIKKQEDNCRECFFEKIHAMPDVCKA